MNRRDAAFHLAQRYPGGFDAIAPRLGKRPDTLRKELTGVNGYKWGVDDEEALIAMCIAANVPDALAPITAEAVNLGALLIPLPQTVDAGSDVFHRLAHTAQEFSKFISDVAKAIEDNQVTANELRRAEADLANLVSDGQGCVAVLRKMHDDLKPAHERRR